MNEFIMSLPEIPQDDILLEYSRADEVTKRAVSALLEKDGLRWILGTLDVELLHNIRQLQEGETIGIGLYKCEKEYIPTLLLNALGSFSLDEPEYMEEAMTALSVWIAQRGEGTLKRVVDQTQDILNGRTI